MSVYASGLITCTARGRTKRIGVSIKTWALSSHHKKKRINLVSQLSAAVILTKIVLDLSRRQMIQFQLTDTVDDSKGSTEWDFIAVRRIYLAWNYSESEKCPNKLRYRYITIDSRFQGNPNATHGCAQYCVQAFRVLFLDRSVRSCKLICASTFYNPILLRVRNPDNGLSYDQKWTTCLFLITLQAIILFFLASLPSRWQIRVYIKKSSTIKDNSSRH